MRLSFSARPLRSGLSSLPFLTRLDRTHSKSVSSNTRRSRLGSGHWKRISTTGLWYDIARRSPGSDPSPVPHDSRGDGWHPPLPTSGRDAAQCGAARRRRVGFRRLTALAPSLRPGVCRSRSDWVRSSPLGGRVTRRILGVWRLVRFFQKKLGGVEVILNPVFEKTLRGPEQAEGIHFEPAFGIARARDGRFTPSFEPPSFWCSLPQVHFRAARLAPHWSDHSRKISPRRRHSGVRPSLAGWPLNHGRE